MATIESLSAKVQSLIDQCKAVTGDENNNLTTQIVALTGMTASEDAGLTPTYETVQIKLQNLIAACQIKTGDSSNDLTVQVGLLIDSFGVVPGLYNANDELVASWDELVTTYGMDVTTDYTYSDYTEASHPCKVLSKSALSSGVKLVIDDSVTSIGKFAFDSCNSLTSVTLPDNMTNIGYAAFNACTKLTGINIPDGVTSISERAFANCTSLTSVTFGENSQLTSIGNYAFAYCTDLTSIDIPDSVTSIGRCAFGYCESLASITFEGTVEQWNAITKGDGWTQDCGEIAVTCTDGTVSLS